MLIRKSLLATEMETTANKFSNKELFYTSATEMETTANKEIPFIIILQQIMHVRSLLARICQIMYVRYVCAARWHYHREWLLALSSWTLSSWVLCIYIYIYIYVLVNIIWCRSHAESSRFANTLHSLLCELREHISLSLYIYIYREREMYICISVTITIVIPIVITVNINH